MSSTGDRNLARSLSRQPQLPAFHTDEEERAFWRTHRPGDYVDGMVPERVQVSRRFRDRVRERKKT